MAKCQSGKNIALLVGCNYPDNEGLPALRGCHNDVDAMRATLINVYGFDPSDIEVLTDKPGTQREAMPTGANIKSALSRLISQLGDGDVMFFHFSGHGTRVLRNARELEAIVPCDANVLTNVDFRELVNNVPPGATFMFFSDSCHSGGLIDKEKEQIGPHTSFRSTIQPDNYRYVPHETVVAALLETLPMLSGPNNTPPDIDTIMQHAFGDDASLLFRQTRGGLPPPLEHDQGILLSACQSDENTGECTYEGICFGQFSSAVQIIIKEKLLSETFSNKQLVMKVREIKPNQHACLYCSDDNANRTFLSDTKKTSRSEREGYGSSMVQYC